MIRLSGLSCQEALRGALKMALFAGLLLGGIFTANGQENPGSIGQSELFHGSHLPNDRETSRRLRIADELIAARRYSDAVRLLDDVLAAKEDFFDADGESMKRLALDRLLALPSGGQRAYALLLQSQRDRALIGADRVELAELAARFPPELLGAPVWRAWAAAESEQGHYAHAAQLLRTMVSVAQDEPTSLANDSLALAIQLARTGREDAAARALGQSGTAEPTETVTQLLRATRSAQQQWASTRSPEAWLGAAGDAVRNSRVPGEAPLAWRRWRASLVTNASDASRLARLTKSIAQAPRLAAQSIVAVDGKLIASTASDLVAIDSVTGKRLWSVPRQRPEARGTFVDDSPEVALLDSAVESAWLDRVQGGISSDGQHLFTIGESSTNISAERNRSRFSRFRGSELPLINALKAHSIAAEGKLVWTLDGGDKKTGVAGAFFLGAPVAYEGRLMALAQIDQTICFLLIDAMTGQVEWQQSLATLERGVEDNESLRLMGAVPTVAGGLVICPTGVGVVVAVDPNRRTLAWSYRLPVEEKRLQDVRRHDWRRFSPSFDLAWRQKPGWRETRAIATDKRLLFVSPESDRLHCLDLKSGNEIWSETIPQGLALGAVTSLPQEQEMVVLVIEADAISAREVATGKQLWRLALSPGDSPAGSGLLVENRFLLPLSSGRLAVLPLNSEKPSLDWIELGPDPFDTPATGGALAYHRGAIYVRTGTALARYDQPSPKSDPSGSELKARLATSLLRGAQSDLTTVPSAAEQLAELVTDRAGQRQIAILQIEAAVDRHDRPAAMAAAFRLAKLNPTEAVIENHLGDRMAADRWASAQVARLGEPAVDDMQQLIRSLGNEADLGTIETLFNMFDFVPRFTTQMAEELDAEQRYVLRDRLALLNHPEQKPTPSETVDDWATHQITTTLSVIESPKETRRRSPVFRHRRTTNKNQPLDLRQANMGEGVPREWRLVGDQSESHDLLGVSDEGERLALLTLPTAINPSIRLQGIGSPGHWQWGPYLILSIEGQVSVYDTRPEVGAEEQLLWTTSGIQRSPSQVIHLREGKATHAPPAQLGSIQIHWVGPKGVVLQQDKRLVCRDLLTGRQLWQRSFSPIERTLGNGGWVDGGWLDDGHLYAATSKRTGKVLSLVDGATLSDWQPPRGKWQVAQGTRLITTRESATQVYDFSESRTDPLWQQPFASGSLLTTVGDAGFAILDPHGKFSFFDLQKASLKNSLKEGPQFVSQLQITNSPKSLHVYDFNQRLLVVVNEIGAEEHRSLGNTSLSKKPLVTGKVYCLDPLTGVPLWQSPVSLDGDAFLPATITHSPIAFFGSRQTVTGMSDAAVTKNRLVLIDMASGRTLYRNDSLPAGTAQSNRFWVQRESTPSPRLLVSLGPARLKIDLTPTPSPPSPPYQALVERRDSSAGSNLSGIGRDLGRLFRSMIAPETTEDEE